MPLALRDHAIFTITKYKAWDEDGIVHVSTS